VAREVTRGRGDPSVPDPELGVQREATIQVAGGERVADLARLDRHDQVIAVAPGGDRQRAAQRLGVARRRHAMIAALLVATAHMTIAAAALRVRRGLVLAHRRLHHGAGASAAGRELELVAARAGPRAEVLAARQRMRRRDLGAGAGHDRRGVAVAIDAPDPERLGLDRRHRLGAHAGGRMAISTKCQRLAPIRALEVGVGERRMVTRPLPLSRDLRVTGLAVRVAQGRGGRCHRIDGSPLDFPDLAAERERERDGAATDHPGIPGAGGEDWAAAAVPNTTVLSAMFAAIQSSLESPRIAALTEVAPAGNTTSRHPPFGSRCKSCSPTIAHNPPSFVGHRPVGAAVSDSSFQPPAS
jgi:hypothetical protein